MLVKADKFIVCFGGENLQDETTLSVSQTGHKQESNNQLYFAQLLWV